MKQMLKMLYTYVLIEHVNYQVTRVLLRALGFSSDQEIVDLLGDNEYLRNTLEKDGTENTEQALLETMLNVKLGEAQLLKMLKVYCIHVSLIQNAMT